MADENNNWPGYSRIIQRKTDSHTRPLSDAELLDVMENKVN